MSVFTPQQQDELARLVKMQIERSDLATLVRQLQGFATDIVADDVALLYTASNVTAAAVIPHGRSSTPVAVVAMANIAGHLAFAQADATNLTVRSQTRDGSSISGGVGVYYIAIFGTA